MSQDQHDVVYPTPHTGPSRPEKWALSQIGVLGG
jgi:hypothetical protein